MMYEEERAGLEQHLSARDFDRVKARVLPAIYEDPSDLEALMYLGIAQTEGGEQEAATRTLLWYLHEGGRNGRAHEALGCAYLRQDRFAEAEPQLVEARRAMPHQSSIHRNLAILYHRTGREQLAYESLKRSLDDDPADILSLCALIPVVQNLGHDQEARPLAERLLSLDPPPDIRAFAEATLRRLSR